MNYKHHDWAKLSREEYLKMRLRDLKIPENKIERLIKEIAQSTENETKKDEK